MALPTAFAALTAATGAQLDGNFAALGALTPIPCALSGTNALVLAPIANTPALSGYTTYAQFTAVAGATNTGATTAKVGALAALPVYKDSLSGPVALSGGEIIANVAFVLMYDVALNAGGGGFHLLGTAAGSFVPLSGGTLTGSITVPSVQIGTSASAVLSSALSTKSSITFGSGTLLPWHSSVAYVTLAGASINDVILLSLPPGWVGPSTVQGRVSVAGTVVLTAANPASVSDVTAFGTIAVAALRFTP